MMKLSGDEAVELIQWLQKQPGWIDYSGDASIQAALPLHNGGYLRVGLTDDDVAPGVGIWTDLYEGLKIKGYRYYNG